MCKERNSFEIIKYVKMSLENNIIGFHHVSVKAQNVNDTVSFYSKLGFEVIHSWSLPDFNLEKCVMLHHKAINYYLEICDKNADMPTQGRKRKEGDEYIENALLHLCFTVKNAAEARKEALKYGAKDLSEGVSELDLINENKSVKVVNSLVHGLNGEVIEFLESVDFG